MPNRLILSLLLPVSLCAAPEWLLIRAVDGTRVEGQTQLRSVKVESEGKTVDLPLSQILSMRRLRSLKPDASRPGLRRFRPAAGRRAIRPSKN